jgi:hypothetical protein
VMGLLTRGDTRVPVLWAILHYHPCTTPQRIQPQYCDTRVTACQPPGAPPRSRQVNDFQTAYRSKYFHPTIGRPYPLMSSRVCSDAVGVSRLAD